MNLSTKFAAFMFSCTCATRTTHGSSSLARISIQARDVSIALSVTEDSTILNRIPAVIEGFADARHPLDGLARLDCGGAFRRVEAALDDQRTEREQSGEERECGEHDTVTEVRDCAGGPQASEVPAE